MKFLVSIASMFFYYSYGIAQEFASGRPNPFQFLQDLQVQVYLNPSYEANNPDYKGTPYFNKEWILGTLFFNDGSSIEGLKFKYDVYNRSMYFTNGQDTASIGNPGILKEIKFGDHRILFTSFLLEKEKVGKDYFELIEDGEYRLLLHRYCTLLPAEKVVQGYGQTEPARFITDKTFYLKQKENPAVIIDKENVFLNNFPDKADDIERFIKTNKLKLKREEDLLQLVKYLNSGS